MGSRGKSIFDLISISVAAMTIKSAAIAMSRLFISRMYLTYSSVIFAIGMSKIFACSCRIRNSSRSSGPANSPSLISSASRESARISAVSLLKSNVNCSSSCFGSIRFGNIILSFRDLRAQRTVREENLAREIRETTRKIFSPRITLITRIRNPFVLFALIGAIRGLITFASFRVFRARFLPSQIQDVIDLRRLQTFLAHFQDDISAVDRRVKQDVSQKIADCVLVW